MVVGSGGREHALAWKLSESDLLDTIYVAPGNGGTAHNVPIPATDVAALAEYAQENDCFTVVGPEAPLAAGISDEFARRGLEIFGPSRSASRLESSKSWAKEFMVRHKIRTAGFEVFEDAAEASEYVQSVDHKVVVKADGLAAGKGVVVCDDAEEAKSAISDIMIGGRFGSAGGRVVIEERLEGQEASCIAICDGRTVVPMASSHDHKRARDGDIGPNTGGMGAVSPTPRIVGRLADAIQSDVVERTVRGMRSEGSPFVGFLYAGIIIRDGEAFVLEYNVRMGDPECQSIVMRMDFDLYQYMSAAVSGRLDSLPPPRWLPGHAVCVVLASRGYPGKYGRGQPIGLPDTPPGARIFHAGTTLRGSQLVSDGGRVLGVTAMGEDPRQAASRAYGLVEAISWQDKYFRHDIGPSGRPSGGDGSR